jgi:hypothetical protein
LIDFSLQIVYEQAVPFHVGLQNISTLKQEAFNWDTEHVDQISRAVFGCMGILQTSSSLEFAKVKENESQCSDSLSLKTPSASQNGSFLPPPTRERYIMISYNVTNKALVRKIREELEKVELKTWVAYKNLWPGSPNEVLHTAIERASAVLVCCSDGYKKSADCRAQAQHAIRHMTPMLFAQVEKGYRQEGWLAHLFCNNPYFDLSESALPFETVSSKLIEAVNNVFSEGLGEKSSSYNSKEGCPTWANWNRDQVQEWLLKNELNFLSEM